MFLTFLTPTYKRPRQLAACLRSVGQQTAVADIEQIVLPDHVGVGVGGMFASLPKYAAAVHGDYVHLLADDDELAAPNVVAAVRLFADLAKQPELILVRVWKHGIFNPEARPAWPPEQGSIDLGCLITRADVWKAHVQDYGQRYEGDFDFAQALCAAGIQAEFCDVHFLSGAVNRGAAEAAA